MTRKYFIALLAPILFFVPLISSAATLSQSQMNAVINLLTSFGVDGSMIANVKASLTGSASATAPSSYAFSQDLTIGESGADVAALQNLLISKGYLSGSATGYFGLLTKKAVIKWQKTEGISPASGYIDTTSRSVLNSSITSAANTTNTTASTNTTGAMTQAQLDAQNAALGRTQFNVAPVTTPSPAAVTTNSTPATSYANSCNGSQYPACLNGSHFVCLGSSSGYCIQDTTPVTQPAQIIPQATQPVAPVPTTTKAQPSVSVSLALSSPTQGITEGALGVKFASFNIVASGENVVMGDVNIHAVTMTSLGTVAGQGGLKNGKVFLNGLQVGSTEDIRSLDKNYPFAGLPPTSFEFNPHFILPVGQTVTLDIYADAKDVSGANLPANSTASVVLDVGGGQGQSSLKSVSFPSTMISGSTLTVLASAKDAQCQQQYNQSVLSLGDGGVQSATNNYNNVVAQTYQIINNCGASGTCFSGARGLAQQQLGQAKSQLDSATSQYQTNLGVLKNTLQTCLGN